MLKAILDTLEGVDDAVKALYTETDGKFVLNLADEEIEKLPSVRGLSTANKENAKKAQDRLDAIESMKAQIAELQKGAPDTAATQAKLAQLQEQLDAANAAAGEWQGKYVGVTRDQSLQQALQTAGIVNPTFLKAAVTMLSGQVKLGDDGTAYVETNMGPKVLADYVKAWASSEGKDFVAPPSGGGAGGGGKSGLTPSKKPEEMSAQERGQLLQENPDEFYKLYPHAKLR